jgi:hypothetical protein
MRVLRLNMWQRIGVLLTLGWVAGSAIHWWGRIQHCAAVRSSAPWACDFKLSDAAGSDAWFWALPNLLQLWRLGLMGNALYAVAMFPLLVWLASLAAVWSVRWVLAGRQSHTGGRQ